MVWASAGATASVEATSAASAQAASRIGWTPLSFIDDLLDGIDDLLEAV